MHSTSLQHLQIGDAQPLPEMRPVGFGEIIPSLVPAELEIVYQMLQVVNGRSLSKHLEAMGMVMKSLPPPLRTLLQLTKV